MTVMKLPFTFVDRLGSSVQYKYLPASTLSFLYCSFFLSLAWSIYYYVYVWCLQLPRLCNISCG